MNLKQFTMLIVFTVIGGIIGGFMSDQLASNGQAYANGGDSITGREEMEPNMDIRKKFERSQQVGKRNRNIAEIINKKILPEKEYEALLETARNEVRGMGLDELREKLASLQAINICLITYMGKYLYSQDRKQDALSKP